MPRRRDESGRGERVLPGVWRLRLTLPWPGVPHCNAWAIASGDGLVLVDTGMHLPGSMEQLEHAMEMVGLRVEQVRLLCITHAHPDHWGQAATIAQRAGCPVWMHPDVASAVRGIDDREAVLAQRLEIARHSGVGARAIAEYAALAKEMPVGVAGVVTPDRQLRDGVRIPTDLGDWDVHETPGHAPNHVCFYQPEQRMLISGDHVLGRITLYWEFGATPDPVGEFLRSLDRVSGLRARLALSGHGKPFLDVPGHIGGTRRLTLSRLEAVAAALGDRPQTAMHIAVPAFAAAAERHDTGWLVSQTLCLLTHLEAIGRARREERGELVLWRAAQP